MRLTDVQLRTIDLPLVSPFSTSFGTQHEKTALLVRVTASVTTSTGPVEVTGWGECVAMDEPVYSSEFVAGAIEVLRRFLVPRLVAAGDRLTPERVLGLLGGVVGHPMAKAALEMAVLDAALLARGLSFGEFLGAEVDRVPAGVSVGIQDSIEATLRTVGTYLDAGYVRIKLKVRPGWDIAPVRAVRAGFGDDLLLQVDANAAYSLADAHLLRPLDDFNLLLIEQPLHEDDLRQHAQLAALLRTPICLDESITSARAAADAIALGACRIINIKPGRVGGYLEARRIHDLAVAQGIAVWCGGMLETGLGRGANAALAALQGFVLPGDISGSDRFYEQDITEPFVLEDGHVAVPTGPGISRRPLPDVLERVTSWREQLTLDPVETPKGQ